MAATIIQQVISTTQPPRQRTRPNQSLERPAHRTLKRQWPRVGSTGAKEARTRRRTGAQSRLCAAAALRSSLAPSSVRSRCAPFAVAPTTTAAPPVGEAAPHRRHVGPTLLRSVATRVPRPSPRALGWLPRRGSRRCCVFRFSLSLDAGGR